MGRRSIGLVHHAAIVAACVWWPMASGAGGLRADREARPVDFDGDGHADLAVGMPGSDHDGSVSVLPGASGGLSGTESQLWHRDVAGVEGEPEGGFGRSLAAGDFDGDGHGDLAVGNPADSNGTWDTYSSGSVNVLYGTASGLSATGDQLWHRDVPGIHGVVVADARFGDSLAAGDFDGDGRYDLAVGVPGDVVEGLDHAGSVTVLYGGSSGLTAEGNQRWNREVAGIGGAAAVWDSFGSVVAAGDFDSDGYDDLAASALGPAIEEGPSAGSVTVFYGGPGGLSAARDQYWHRGVPGVNGSPGGHDGFGWALAAGDFDGDGRYDLAIGVPHDHVHGVHDAGSVNVLYGTPSGLSADRDQMWYRDKPRIDGVAAPWDKFGNALAAGDLDGDGRDDLAIGVRLDDISGNTGAGSVQVLYGTGSGLSAVGDQVWHQDQPGVSGVSEPREHFGNALTVSDFDGDSYGDLAIAVPNDTIGLVRNDGAVNVLYGTDAGLSAAGDQHWYRGKDGIERLPGFKWGYALPGSETR